MQQLLNPCGWPEEYYFEKTVAREHLTKQTYIQLAISQGHQSVKKSEDQEAQANWTSMHQKTRNTFAGFR